MSRYPDVVLCCSPTSGKRERVCWPTPRTGAACTASSSWPSHLSSPLADWRRLSHLQMTSSHVDIRLMLLTSSKRGCRDSYSYSERLEALQKTRFIGRGLRHWARFGRPAGPELGTAVVWPLEGVRMLAVPSAALIQRFHSSRRAFWGWLLLPSHSHSLHLTQCLPNSLPFTHHHQIP